LAVQARASFTTRLNEALDLGVSSGEHFAGLRISIFNLSRFTVMSTSVQAIPEGFHTATPYLTVKGGRAALDFYERAFGAKQRFLMPGPDGQTVGHAEFVIGNSIFMIADEHPGMNKSPQTLGGSPISIVLYVEDCDAGFHRAVEAGATATRELKDQFYGDRSGSVVDPFGYEWHLMTHKEDVSPEEMQKRMAEMCAKNTPA
jgi:PhnB protein